MKQRVLIGSGVVLAIATVGVAVAIAGFGGDGGGDSDDALAPQARRTIAPRDPGTAGPPALRRSAAVPAARSAPVPSVRRQPLAGRYFPILALGSKARVALYASRRGRLVSFLDGHSEFGSPLVLGVVRQRGSWLGVSTPLRSDDELGWLRFDSAKMNLYWTRYSLRIGLSKRVLQLRYGGRVVARYPVTVGAAGSDTPRGRFAITDALVYGNSPYYGCCALALSGHQRRLPVGWLGGDRLAIHGTPGPVGLAASHGCIRATDDAMRVLFRRVPLGAPVFVRG